MWQDYDKNWNHNNGEGNTVRLNTSFSKPIGGDKHFSTRFSDSQQSETEWLNLSVVVDHIIHDLRRTLVCLLCF